MNEGFPVRMLIFRQFFFEFIHQVARVRAGLLGHVHVTVDQRWKGMEPDRWGPTI
jgi:hypothetical protein